MRLKKAAQLAINIFIHSKLRSWLTIIGIIVGIAAVVAIISMSLGAQQQLKDRLASLGADVLTVSPGMQRAMGPGFGGGPPGEGGGSQTSSTSTSKNITERDLIVLRNIPNVEYVMGQVSGTATVSYSSKTVKKFTVSGVDVTVWKDITTDTLTSGRLLKSGDLYAAVIGKDVATSVFGKDIPINTKITIGGKTFNVVGILSSGRSIYIPLDAARSTLDDVGADEFDSVSVKIKDVTLANETVTQITKKLMLAHGILQEKNIDFSVSNPATMQATMESTMNTMTMFLAAIAAISLVVGAIGIANTMFTSVLEQTREIGIMKAIGTQNKDILTIFLLNSGLIGLVGGIGGIIVGVLSSTAINSLAGISTTTATRGGPPGGAFSILGSSSVVSPQLLIGALLFAVLIGMVAGVIPAYRASKLNPVDALRYE